MDPASPDARLSNYRLERLLGAGGMGSVYLARDLALDRPVAIKFITPDKAADASARRRLIREARAAAALDHPNICGVHEVIDEPDGRACIVMQYVEGETLAEVLRRGPLEVRQALDMAGDLAAALAAAHARNIIHRDVKPQNVIITTDRRTMLLDFGIARQNDSEAAADDVTATSLTTAGMIVGTPAYMSPEQAQQLPIDGRSDLFSLGAVLFECLTGQRAFKGDTPLRLASEILQHHPPAVSTLRAGLTEQHDELCRRLLAKHPDDRFKSAEELLGALRVLKTDTGRQAVTPDRGPDPANGSGAEKRVRSRRALMAMAAVIVLAAVGSWAWMKPNADFEGTPEAIALYEQGTGWIRAGAYDSGRRALQGAIELAPGYVPAYVRLAEASAELDDHTRAQEALLRVDEFVPDEARLGVDDRLRVRAVRAVMLRELNGAVRAYEDLAKRRPKDAGALLDLGRALQASGRPAEARGVYQLALAIDANHAAAYLRLARAAGDQGDSRAAFDFFAKAEKIYSTSTNNEGLIETLLMRGMFSTRIGDIKAARPLLERTLDLAKPLGHKEQSIRTELALSTVLAWEGRFKEARAMAARAVDDALQANLDTIAADGLIDLAIGLINQRQTDTSREEHTSTIDGYLNRAISLAQNRNAQRTVARATLQRAAVMAGAQEYAGALKVAEKPTQFLREKGYRRDELTAQLIISRAHEGLGNLDQARQGAEAVLRIATEIEDRVQQASALENLAGQATAAGDLPAAAEFRKRGADIHRQQSEASTLAFDLTNHAELLIRLGKRDEADRLLDEVEERIAAKDEAFMGRTRRTTALRALAATVERRFADAARLAATVASVPDGLRDSPGKLAARLLACAEAERGKRIPVDTAWLAEDPSTSGRELRYWELAGRLASGDAQGVLDQALLTLGWKGTSVSPEYEWRIAAVGAAAARRLKNSDRAKELATRSESALGRLGLTWKKDDMTAYLARPDVTALIRQAGLNTRS